MINFPFRGKKSLPRFGYSKPPVWTIGAFLKSRGIFWKDLWRFPPPLLRGGFRNFFWSKCLNSSPRVDFFVHRKNGVMGYKLQTKNLVMADVLETSPTHFVPNNQSLTNPSPQPVSFSCFKEDPAATKAYGGCSSIARGTSPARLGEVYTSQVGLRKMW